MKPVPNYYTLLDIPEYSAFYLKDDDLMDRLLMVLCDAPHGSFNNAMAKFETGIYILMNDYIKERYDYILRYGWITVLSNPLKVLYVWYIITLILVRMRINLVLAERRGDPLA